MSKKKKYSKLKKAKLRYLEIKSQEERMKDQQAIRTRKTKEAVNDDGFETIDEGEVDRQDNDTEPVEEQNASRVIFELF